MHIHFVCTGTNYQTWHISNLDQFNDEETWRDAERIETTERAFEEIKGKVDKLIKSLA